MDILLILVCGSKLVEIKDCGLIKSKQKYEVTYRVFALDERLALLLGDGLLSAVVVVSLLLAAVLLREEDLDLLAVGVKWQFNRRFFAVWVILWGPPLGKFSSDFKVY